MITYEEAINKANKYLYDEDAPVVITLHGRFAEGWFFCFESREYLETGDNAARLAGNGPFIIDKDSGEIFELDTAWPLEKYLKDYEESKKTRS
ncbi:YrhB domain-containing protein [Citrobacter portucalensis]|uniref:YrhB domain-containing protein n=1 Tax=Citrobacter portucalensis TaxID=1639133 RepID=UPI003BF58BE2